MAVCPLCGSPTGGADRCPSCGLFLEVADPSGHVFTGRTVWTLVAGIAAVYVVVLVIVLLAR